MKFLFNLYVAALACLLFAPLFCVMDVDVNIYAVGQGNGILVKGGDHAMLIDAGSSASRLTALFHNRAFRDGRLEGEKERYKIDNPEEKNEDDSESATENQAAPAPQLPTIQSQTVAGKVSVDLTASATSTSPTPSSALVQDTGSQSGEGSSNATTPEAASTSPQTTHQETPSNTRHKRSRNDTEAPEEADYIQS